MAGVNFKAIADWVGHKDGEAPVAKTDSMLTNDRSRRAAAAASRLTPA
jgi:hypothetical protein